MPHVPRQGHSRRTHGRVARKSHSHSGYLAPLQGAQALVDQDVIDGVLGPGDIPPGTIDADGAIIPGSLSITPFADEVRPVAIVDTLPTLPDAAYPDGSVVVLTTDHKLYRNDAGTWTKAVDGADLVADSVTAGAISAGAVGASEIAAGAVTADELAAGAVTAGKLNVVNFASGELLSDGQFDWLGAGDTRYWTLGTDWSVNAAGANSIYARGRYRLRGIFAAGADRYAENEGGIKVAESGLYAIAIEHAIESMSAGVLSVEVQQFDSSNSLLSTTTVMQWSATQTFRAEGCVIAGSAATVPAGLTTALTLSSNCAYILVRLKASAAAVVSNWWITGIAVVQGSVPLLGSSPGNLYTGVHIDGGGIIIYDGKFVMKDEFQTTIADAAGFSGGWLDMIRTGLYNGSLDGPLGTISDGRTADLPYWTVSRFQSPAAFVESDSAYKGGKRVRVAFNAVNDQINFASDLVGITAGEAYALILQCGIVAAAGLVAVTAGITYYDIDGDVIDSSGSLIVWNILGSGTLPATNVDGRTSFSDVSGNFLFQSTYNSRAPLNAAFAKVNIGVNEQTTHSGANEVYLGAISMVPCLEGTPAQFHAASNNQTLTTTPDSFPGMLSLGVTRGHYEAKAVFDFDVQVASAGVVCVAQLVMKDPTIEVSGSAATNLLTATAPHGLAVNDPIEFMSLGGGAGLDVGTIYYVIASGLTSTAFKVSATLGGGEVNFTTDVTAGSWVAERVVVPGQALFKSDAGDGRGTVYQQWEITPRTANGSLPAHLDFELYKTGAGGTMVCNAAHSNVWITPIP